jgi:hypothetical protein
MRISSSRRNLIIALSQNKMSSSAILSHLQMTVCLVQATWF